jgi:hypothetical protein
MAACWLTASRNPPRFEYEGEFRRWLVRVLIDEASAILRNKTKSGVKNAPQSAPRRRTGNLQTTVLE